MAERKFNYLRPFDYTDKVAQMNNEFQLMTDGLVDPLTHGRDSRANRREIVVIVEPSTAFVSGQQLEQNVRQRRPLVGETYAQFQARMKQLQMCDAQPTWLHLNGVRIPKELQLIQIDDIRA